MKLVATGINTSQPTMEAAGAVLLATSLFVMAVLSAPVEKSQPQRSLRRKTAIAYDEQTLFMSRAHWKSLRTLLVCICILVGLVALPTVLQVRRSLPVTGEVTEVTEFESQQRDSDGQMVSVSSSNHRIQFKNPRTGTIENKVLQDIYKDKGQSVHILFDPKDSTIELDSYYRLFKTPIWLLGTLMLMWIGLVIIARS